VKPKQKKKQKQTSRTSTPRNAVPANRTSDESPAGAEEQTRRIENRDILESPGQVPLTRQPRSSLTSDELYGQTRIPGRKDDDQQVRTKTPEKSARAKTKQRPGS